MHKEILVRQQEELLPFLNTFSANFGLVGGTAVALLLGHRRSIDFDLFTQKQFYSSAIRDQIRTKYKIAHIYVDKPNELTVLVNDVKLTFYKYPFRIAYTHLFYKSLKLPNVVTLAAMKAFALGRRAKWKDYVDLYYILQKHSLKEIVNKAKAIFGAEFNEKLLREQLAYFEDIDYTEKVDFMEGFEVADEKIKNALTQISLQE